MGSTKSSDVSDAVIYDLYPIGRQVQVNDPIDPTNVKTGIYQGCVKVRTRGKQKTRVHAVQIGPEILRIPEDEAFLID